MGCRFELGTTQRTPALVLVGPHRSVSERTERQAISVEPDGPIGAYVDDGGNVVGRLDLPAGLVTLEADAVVDVDPWADPELPSAMALDPHALPADVLEFLRPSRYCESDLLAARALQQFGTSAPGWAQVQDVMDWVHGHIRFDYGRASTGHTAASVLASGEGVCRDYAHLAIALCRALNVPARYAFGYLPDIGVPAPPDPMDFCAWTEVYLGGEWHTFDPRNNQRRIGRVVAGRGRDAADVPMLTTFGQVQLVSMTVWADEHADAPDAPDAPGGAVDVGSAPGQVRVG